MNNNKLIIFVIAALGIGGSVESLAAPDASSKATLRALGQAYQQEYIQTKKLGAHPTSQQRVEVRKKTYAKVDKMLQAESAKTRAKMTAEAVRAGKNMRKLASNVKHKKKGGKGGKKKAGKKGDSAATPDTSRNADSTTGHSGAAGGAEQIQIGGKGKAAPQPEKKSSVKDGIIQDR